MSMIFFSRHRPMPVAGDRSALKADFRNARIDTHTMIIELTVPDSFHSPVPRDWTAEETATALEIGVASLQRVMCNLERAGHDNEGRRMGQQDVLRQVREVLATRASGREAQLETDASQAREKQATAEGELTLLRAKCDELQTQLRVNAVPANKGNDAERCIIDCARDAGLFAYDVGKGAHNTHYHDVLVANVALSKREATDGPCAYDAAPSLKLTPPIRCSVESKHYSRTVGTAEIERFAAVRARMLLAQSADCFVFAATAPLAGRQRRLEYEWTLDQAGGPHVTAYLGDRNVSPQDVTDVVLATFALQKQCTQLLAARGRPRCEAESVSQAVADGLLRAQLRQLQRLDASLLSAEGVAEGLRSQRLDVVRELMLGLERLRSVDRSRHEDDPAMARALRALATLTDREQRDKTCSIVRTKCEFGALQRALREEGTMPFACLKRSRAERD